MFFDSHAHLDMPEYASDRTEVIDRARRAGVERILVVGNDLPSSEASMRLAQQYDGLYASVGVHPHDARHLDEAALERLREMAQGPRVVAIGEIGLDFYRNLSPRVDQLRGFEQQLDLAAELDRPVVVHDRDAHDEVLRVLRRWASRRAGGRLGVMHCFSGDWRMAEECIELGFLVSLAGPVTYPRSERATEVASRVPWDALLIETDSPYLAPQPHRGRRNEPAHVVAVAARIAELRGVPLAEVANRTTANACRLLRLG